MHKFYPLSNGEVENLLKSIKGFKGVSAKDEFSGPISPLEYGVINIDDSTGPGTHFTAYANRPGDDHVYYYDSYGVVCPKNIEKYLKTSGKPIAYNNSQHQLIDSVICGFYCCMFIVYMSKGSSFYDFLSLFTDNHIANDNLVKKWAISKFKSFFK